MAPTFPPGPRTRYPGDLSFRLRRDSLGFLAEQVAVHGNVFGFRTGTQRFVFVNEPDLIRDVLVARRQLAQPGFQRDRLAGAAGHVVDHAARLSNCWRDGQEIDAHAEMMRLTLSVVAETLFDASVDDVTDEVGTALLDIMASFDQGQSPFAELLGRLPTPSTIRFQIARGKLNAIVNRRIRDRRGGADERDELMTLFLAGRVTTANALTWVWYKLARNPKAEEELHAEVDALGHPPTMEDLPRLACTRRVLAETMRLYPPAYLLGHRATQEQQLGEYRLPKGTIIACSAFIQHRDARWYPKPEQFDADRWLPDEVAKRPEYSYFPLGAGTGNGIGEQFAWMEATLVLATLAQRWRLWIAPKQRIAIEPKTTLVPRYGMQMVARRR